MTDGSHSTRRIVWPTIFVLLFAWLALRAATLDRSEWPGFIGDEATYLLAAESLAWDGDYHYERRDYDRFKKHWGERSELLLFLQSNDHGQTLVYGKPFFYPLLAAPLTRLSPTHGALLTNVLLLALASAMAARVLTDLLGEEAWLWVSAFVFGSVAFAYAVWAHADSMLMSITTIALSLALRERQRALESGSSSTIRWLVIGSLVGIVAFSRPFYASLLLPVALAIPRPRSWRLPTAFAVGILAVIGFSAAGHWNLAGSLTSYTGERGGFYARVGLPEVDFPGETWDEAIHRTGNFAWHQAREPLQQETRSGLWLWNGLYVLVGEHVGLIPYFLPLLLILLCLRWDRFRVGLALAALLAMSAFFLYRPFNFFGGGAAIGNRYFLPIYPALWFLIGRRPGRRVRQWGPVVVILFALPFLWPLWSRLGSYPLTSEQTYEFVSPAARALLPYETTQSHLKPGGQEDVRHRGIWVRVLSPGTRVDKDRLWVRSGAWAEILIAHESVLEEISIVGPAGRDLKLELETGIVEDEIPGNGVTTYKVKMPRRRARHSMWWRWEPLQLYRLRFRFTGPEEAEIVGLYLAEPKSR